MKLYMLVIRGKRLEEMNYESKEAMLSRSVTGRTSIEQLQPEFGGCKISLLQLNQ